MVMAFYPAIIATVLHQLGLDHEKLTFLYPRPKRPPHRRPRKRLERSRHIAPRLRKSSSEVLSICGQKLHNQTYFFGAVAFLCA